MQSILVVGAGREGKGFLGETFSTDGWQVYFLDKDPEVVNALKTGKYNVTVYQENGTFKREITGYEVYGYDEEYSCLPAVLEAEVIALCLYPEDIPEAAAYLGKGISERARRLQFYAARTKIITFPHSKRRLKMRWRAAKKGHGSVKMPLLQT